VLVFWLTAATGRAHYFLFALHALQVPQVHFFFVILDFGPLPKPGSPFFLPHPHAAHIISYLSYEGSFYAIYELPFRLL
jgi:hypothetical protein